MYLTIYRKPRNGIIIDRLAGPRVTRHRYQQAMQGQTGTSHLIQTTYSTLCAIFSHQWLFCENLNFKALHNCDDLILKYTPQTYVLKACSSTCGALKLLRERITYMYTVSIILSSLFLSYVPQYASSQILVVLIFFLFDNPLSPVSTAHRCMDVRHPSQCARCIRTTSSVKWLLGGVGWGSKCQDFSWFDLVQVTTAAESLGDGGHQWKVVTDTRPSRLCTALVLILASASCLLVLTNAALASGHHRENQPIPSPR